MEKSKQQPSVAEVLQAHCSWIKFLISIVSIWIGVALVFIWLKHVVLDIHWPDCRISLANFLSLGAAIGAIAVAVFAWLAYHYATHQYLRNEIEKLKFEKKLGFIEAILANISEVSLSCQHLELMYKYAYGARIKNEMEDYKKFMIICLEDGEDFANKLKITASKLSSLYSKSFEMLAIGMNEAHVNTVKEILVKVYAPFLVNFYTRIKELNQWELDELKKSHSTESQCVILKKYIDFYSDQLNESEKISTQVSKASKDSLIL